MWPLEVGGLTESEHKKSALDGTSEDMVLYLQLRKISPER